MMSCVCGSIDDFYVHKQAKECVVVAPAVQMSHIININILFKSENCAVRVRKVRNIKIILIQILIKL